jgi:hypothetical protein
MGLFLVDVVLVVVAVSMVWIAVCFTITAVYVARIFYRREADTSVYPARTVQKFK